MNCSEEKPITPASGTQIAEQTGSTSFVSTHPDLDQTAQGLFDRSNQDLARDRAKTLRIMCAEQRERHRFATELHDELAQVLAVCKMKLSQVARPQDSDPAEQLLLEVEQLMEASLERARTLVAHLNPTVLYEGGLLGAIKWIARQMLRHGLSVTVRSTHDPLPRLGTERKTVVVEAIRELLHNIVQHAGVQQATVALAFDEQNLQITVSDTGAGFDADAWHADPLQKEGCGLLQVKHRMEAIGGRADLAASHGAGTKVVLTVPCLPPTHDQSLPGDTLRPDDDARPVAPELQSRSKIHVLLADDHAIVRQGLRGVLEHEPDIEVVGEAACGEQALELAGHLEPDVLVLDVSMPGMSGIETARRIKADFPWVQIIGLSVHDDPGLVAAMKEAGAAAYLTKGGSIEQLCATVRRLAGARR